MKDWRPFENPEDDLPVIDDAMLAPEVDFERGMSSFPVVSILIAAFCAAAFLSEVVQGAMVIPLKMDQLGAITRAALGKEPWRLVSGVFLHGSVDHFLGNVLILLVLGLGAEHAFGRMQFLSLFVAAGIAGSMLSATQHDRAVGASGAIFGVAGGLMAMFYRWRQRLHLRDKRIGGVLAIWAGYQIFLGVFNPIIDNHAHLGGLVAGLILGFILHPAVLLGRKEVSEEPLVRTAFVATVLLLIGVASIFVPRLLGM
jgi:rhomboid protease GluP